MERIDGRRLPYVEINRFVKSLRNHDALSQQQKRTLKGQALSGDLEGAQKGLDKLLRAMNKGA